jgi:hypothetical protein
VSSVAGCSIEIFGDPKIIESAGERLRWGSSITDREGIFAEGATSARKTLQQG